MEPIKDHQLGKSILDTRKRWFQIYHKEVMNALDSIALEYNKLGTLGGN